MWSPVHGGKCSAARGGRAKNPVSKLPGLSLQEYRYDPNFFGLASVFVLESVDPIHLVDVVEGVDQIESTHEEIRSRASEYSS